MKRILFAALIWLSLASSALAAAITHAASIADTTASENYTSGAFTPAAGDLIVVSYHQSGSVVQGVVTSSDGLTFTLVESGAGDGTDGMYVSDQLASAVSQTINIAFAGDAGTGCVASVERVSGMTRTGASAEKQSATGSGGAGTTPAVTFGASALTGNPTIGTVRNTTNPAGLTAPTSWTELFDSGYITPTRGFESVGRDSGFTGTTITWGSTSATAWLGMSLELDTSAVVANDNRLMLMGVGN